MGALGAVREVVFALLPGRLVLLQQLDEVPGLNGKKVSAGTELDDPAQQLA